MSGVRWLIRKGLLCNGIIFGSQNGRHNFDTTQIPISELEKSIFLQYSNPCQEFLSHSTANVQILSEASAWEASQAIAKSNPVHTHHYACPLLAGFVHHPRDRALNRPILCDPTYNAKRS